jgi:hypothetical protein
MSDDPKNPLDYHSPPNSSLDPDIRSLWWVRFANRRRRRFGILRLFYFIITISAIAALLWYIRDMLNAWTGMLVK